MYYKLPTILLVWSFIYIFPFSKAIVVSIATCNVIDSYASLLLSLLFLLLVSLLVVVAAIAVWVLFFLKEKKLKTYYCKLLATISSIVHCFRLTICLYMWVNLKKFFVLLFILSVFRFFSYFNIFKGLILSAFFTIKFYFIDLLLYLFPNRDDK